MTRLGKDCNEERAIRGAGEVLGKLMEKKAREAGQRADSCGRNGEDDWKVLGMGQTENWENRGQGWSRRSEEREATRQEEMGTEVEMEESRMWGAHRVPEVRGKRVSLWSQPSSSVFVPRGFKEQEAGVQGKSWGVWPSASTSPHLPGPPPTRLSRMQPEVEPFISPGLGAPGSHRETGEQVWGPANRHSHTVGPRASNYISQEPLPFTGWYSGYRIAVPWGWEVLQVSGQCGKPQITPLRRCCSSPANTLISYYFSQKAPLPTF